MMKHTYNNTCSNDYDDILNNNDNNIDNDTNDDNKQQLR